MGTISGELFNYAVLAANAIRSAYLLALQRNYLTEAYEPLNITPKNIQSSLAIIAYEYQSSDNKNNDFLLDLLNKEFSYINMEFKLVNSNGKRLKYLTNGIMSAEADINNAIIIYITEMFLNLVKNLDLDIDSDKVSKTLTEDLMKIYLKNNNIIMAKLKEDTINFLNQDEEVIDKNSIIYRLKHKK